MAIIATWNLEHVFRPGGDFGPKTNAVYHAKLDGLARVIDAIGPDVLAVEEVGDPSALADLVDLLDGDWHVDTSSVFEERHPSRVGFRSRVKITDAENISRLGRLALSRG